MLTSRGTDNFSSPAKKWKYIFFRADGSMVVKGEYYVSIQGDDIEKFFDMKSVFLAKLLMVVQ